MNRLLVLLLAGMLLTCLAVSAIATYVPQPDPFTHRNTQAVFANGKVYYAGGITASNTDTYDATGRVYPANRNSNNEIYDPATNTWDSSRWDGTGPKGIDNNSNGVCEIGEGTWAGLNQGFAYDDDADGTKEIFIHGGYPIWSGGFLRYDPNDDTWADVYPFLFWAAGGPTTQQNGYAVVVGTAVYVFGGQGNWGPVGSESRGMAKFDFTTSTWTELNTTPVDMNLGVAVAIGTNIYCTMGTLGTAIWQYDTTTDTWTDTGATLGATGNFGSTVSYNGKMYIFGPSTADIQIYNPSTNTVTTLTGVLPAAMDRGGAAVDPATGMVYIGGGRQDGAYTNIQKWWKADLDDALPTFTPIADNPNYFPYEDWVSISTDLSGTVTDPFGNPMAGAVVGIKTEPKAAADAQIYAVTDADGNYTAGVPGGTIYVAAWKDGWTPTVDTQVESTGDPLDVDLQLLKVAGKNLSVSEEGRTTDCWATSNDANNPAVNATDGDMGSRWSSAGGDPEDESFIIVPDVDAYYNGVTYPVSGVTIYWEWARPEGYSVDYTQDDMYGFTDPIWTEVYSTTAGSGYQITSGHFVDAILFDAPVDITGIRIHCTEFFGAYGNYSAFEFQVNSATEYASVVYGTVKDTGGSLIAGALVHLGPPSQDTQMYTDSSGSYSFATTPGYSILTADAWQYANVDTIVGMADDGTPTLQDFVLPAKAETNLVPNGNFEEEDPGNLGQPRYWTNKQDDPQGEVIFSRDTTHNNTPGGEACGQYDQRFMTIAKYSGWVNTELFPVVSDGSVLYNFWNWRTGQGENANCQHRIVWYAADGVTVTGDWWYGWYGSETPGIDFWNNNWQWWRSNAQYRMTPPPGSAYAQIAEAGRWAYVNANAINAVDDVILEELDRPVSQTIAELKGLPDGELVAITGKRLTALVGNEVPADQGPGGFQNNTGYIEELDRSAGMFVDITNAEGIRGQYSDGPGDAVDLIGTVGTLPTGEKYLDLIQVTWAGDTRPLDALAMNLRFASTELAQGLFVKLTGTVTAVGGDSFTITDGSVDEAGAPIEMAVYCGGLALPSTNDVVRVRGVLSTNGTQNILLVRNEQVDIVDGDSAIQLLPFQGPVKALRDYLFIGTFGDPADDMTTQLATDYISAATGGTLTEATIRPSLGETVGDNTWFRHDGLDEVVNLNRLFPGNNDHLVAYAHVYVWSPIAQLVDIPVSTDDSGKVWVNGVQLYEFNGIRGAFYGTDCIQDVQLVAGFNSVLIKVVNNDGGFGLVTQFAVPDTWTGEEGWGYSTPFQGLGYLLNLND